MYKLSLLITSHFIQEINLKENFAQWKSWRGALTKYAKQMLRLPPLGGFGWERKDAQNTSSMYFLILVHPT